MGVSVKHTVLTYVLYIGCYCILTTWKIKTTWNSIQSDIIYYHYISLANKVEKILLLVMKL